MKKMIMVFVIISLALSVFGVMEYDKEKFVANTIVVCFEMDSVDDISGRISFEKENGVVVTEKMPSFNEIAFSQRIVDMSQMTPHVANKEWNDDGAYIQNIYRLILENDDVMDETVEMLWKNENIIYAQYEIINRLRFEPNDTSYGNQWHLPQINSEYMWDYINLGEGALIGIVDSGVNWTHPDLQDNIWVNQAEIDAGMTIDWVNGTFDGENGVDDNPEVTQNAEMADDAIGWSFAQGQVGNNSNQTYAENDHGTHVAGCAAAVTNNDIGVVGSAGPANNIKILGTRHSSIYSPSTGIYDGYSGITYCADMGADIINCSWGGPGNGYYPNQYVNYATNQGALVVTAAGNDNTQHIPGSYEDYPSDAENALCVAATDQGDLKTYFSDYGTPIDVSAPGIDILSTVIENQGYGSYQGTSMASPIVAGVAAAVKSLNPELSPLEIRDRIMDTADNIDTINESYAGLLGTGRVNSFRAALSYKLPNLSLSTFDYEEMEGDDGIPNPGELISVDVMIDNDILFWTDAEDITLTLSSDMEGVTVVNNEISMPNMSAGVALWTEEPFTFETDETISELTIPLNLHISANPEWEYPLEKDILFEVELSLEQQGWPYLTGGLTNSSPLAMNLDLEGTREVIFGDQAGNIQVINPDGTSKENFPVSLGAVIASAVAVENIDGDGAYEIVAGNSAGLVKAFNHDGTELFSYDLGGQIKGNPIIADYDGNGEMEIIVTNLTGDVVILDSTGNPINGTPYNVGGGILSSSAVADLNGDGVKELVASLTNGNLIALSLDNMTPIAGFPVSIGATSWNGPIIADIDADENYEVIVATLTGSLFAINHDGSTIFNNNYSGIKTSIVAYDIDFSGDYEIIFGTNDGELFVLDSMGEIVEGFPYEVGAGIESTPALVDFDSDGTIEMLFGDNNGHLHAVNINAEEAANFPIEILGITNVAPAVNDIDFDGDLDIAIPNSSGMHLIDFKRDGIVYWNSFKANPARTGVVSDINPTDENNIEPVFDTRLISNYPNPFNPTTSINFAVDKQSDVEINIYNVLGQRVKTLVDDNFRKGNHSVSWHGTDDNGKKVSSGVYFYRLTQNGQSVDTKKCLLLK